MNKTKKWLKKNGYDPDDEVLKPRTGGTTTKLYNILEDYYKYRRELPLP